MNDQPAKSNLAKFAEDELRRAGQFDNSGDFYGGMMGPAVLKLVETFSAEGHSGMSASIARQLFHKLSDWKPLTPLTGEENEWNDVGNNMLQNARCSAVFKNVSTGKAYFLDGQIFRDKRSTFTCRDSRKPMSFPCDVPESKHYHVIWRPFFRLRNWLSGI